MKTIIIVSLSKYWNKSDYFSAKKWKQSFPNSSNIEIRKFLECFVDGFAFSSKKRLKFEPDDKVMEIYNTIYPPKRFLASDALELETFAMNLEDEYKIKFSEVWQEDAECWENEIRIEPERIKKFF